MPFTFQSDPREPGAKALLAEYAIQQNTADRSKPALNDAMDSKFKPQHDLWSPLWAKQKQAESVLTEKVRKRDEAEEALKAAVAEVLNALEYTQGRGSPVIKQYIPGANLDVTRKPFDKLLAALEPYAPVIASAADEVIPAKSRALFQEKFGAGRTAQAEVAEAKKRAVDAQRARAAQDAAWMREYRAYHRAVEYVADGDRGVIKTWIREWPEEPAPKRSSGKPAEGSNGEAPKEAAEAAATPAGSAAPAEAQASG